MESLSVQSLQMMGCKVPAEGLPRLLDAPIGTRAFYVRADSHLQSATNAAETFAEKIHSLEHATAEYHMLRFCASTGFRMCLTTALEAPGLSSGMLLKHQRTCLVCPQVLTRALLACLLLHLHKPGPVSRVHWTPHTTKRS